MSDDAAAPPARADDPLLDSAASTAGDLWISDPLPAGCHYEDQSMPTSFPDADFELAVRHWRPTDPAAMRAVVVIVHGLHSHSGRWARVAEKLVAAGYGVYAADHALHGRSSPTKLPVCDLPDFNIFVRDTRAVVAMAADAHADLPLFVLGHSMGTVVTICAMHDNTETQKRVRGVVYSGFAMEPGASSAAPMGMKCLFCLIKGCCGICLGGCLAGCGPMADGSVLDESNLNHTKAVLEKMEVDNLHYKGAIRNRMGFEVLKATRRIAKEGMIGAIEYPILVIHGGDDDICLPSGAEALVAGAATPASEKTLHIYPGHFHEVMQEYELENYRADRDVLKFLAAHATVGAGGSGGGAAGAASPKLAEGKDDDDDDDDDDDVGGGSGGE